MRRIVIALLFLPLVACKKNSEESGKETNENYPYTEHEILYMGMKSGLTSSSSDAAFSDGLDEIIQQFAANNPDSSTTFVVDNKTYEMTNLKDVTGGVPNDDWDAFWVYLDKYDHAVGSCWGFSSLHIPSRGARGTIYIIYAIVTNEYDEEVTYIALQGDFVPSKTRSVAAENPLAFLANGKYDCSTRLKRTHE